MEAKQKEMERKLIKSVLRAIYERQALVGPGASRSVCLPLFRQSSGMEI
jgi:hypothetical protein